MFVYGLSTKFTIVFNHIPEFRKVFQVPYLTYHSIHKCSSLSPWYS